MRHSDLKENLLPAVLHRWSGRALHAAVPGEQSARLGERSARPGEQSARLGEQSARLGEQSARRGEQSAMAGERSAGPGEQSATACEQSLKQRLRSRVCCLKRRPSGQEMKVAGVAEKQSRGFRPLEGLKKDDTRVQLRKNVLYVHFCLDRDAENR